MRALKIRVSVQTFGMAAFRSAVCKGMELASRTEQFVRESPDLELLNPVSLSIVCFRVNPAGAELDGDTLEKVNRTVLAAVPKYQFPEENRTHPGKGTGYLHHFTYFAGSRETTNCHLQVGQRFRNPFFLVLVPSSNQGLVAGRNLIRFPSSASISAQRSSQVFCRFSQNSGVVPK